MDEQRNVKAKLQPFPDGRARIHRVYSHGHHSPELLAEAAALLSLDSVPEAIPSVALSWGVRPSRASRSLRRTATHHGMPSAHQPVLGWKRRPGKRTRPNWKRNPLRRRESCLRALVRVMHDQLVEGLARPGRRLFGGMANGDQDGHLLRVRDPEDTLYRLPLEPAHPAGSEPFVRGTCVRKRFSALSSTRPNSSAAAFAVS